MNYSRVASLVISLVYIVMGIATAPGARWLYVVGYCVIPLLCIWLPDEMGSLKGPLMGLSRPAITRPTPPRFVEIAGWIMLLMPIVWVAIQLFSRR
jgi:hypothetical protein